jgi:hypothetical protein
MRANKGVMQCSKLVRLFERDAASQRMLQSTQCSPQCARLPDNGLPEQ